MGELGIVRATQLAYGNYCTLNSCTTKRKAGHKYCSSHNNKLIHRGNPEQQLISIKTRNFVNKSVEQLMADNEDKPAWNELMSAIQERWDGAQVHVNAQLNSYSQGIAMSRTYRKGLIICYDIFNTLGFKKAFISYCGWQYLQEWNPKLFITDEAFRHQMVRSMRNQAKSFHTEHTNKITGRSSAYASPLYMREREVVWEILTSIFGITGIQLFKQIEKRAERLRTNKERIYAAIKHIE